MVFPFRRRDCLASMDGVHVVCRKVYPHFDTVLMISGGTTTVLAPGVFAALILMFGDITNKHERDVGERREGVICAARSFAIEAPVATRLVAGGILADLIAFPRGTVTGSVPAKS